MAHHIEGKGLIHGTKTLQGESISKFCQGYFVYVPSYWETTLHCNVVSHWLGACTKWSLFCTYMDPLYGLVKHGRRDLDRGRRPRGLDVSHGSAEWDTLEHICN